MNILKSIVNAIQKDFFNFEHFFQAIINNDIEKFNWCLKNRIDSKNINQLNNQRYNALSYICDYNRIAFLEQILHLKPFTNIKNTEGKTPLFLLCEQKDRQDNYFGHREIFFGDNISIKEIHEKIDLIKKLLKYGTDVNATDYQKNTPLMRAIHNKYQDVALLLLQFGADATLINIYGQSALSIALVECRNDMKKNLVEAIYLSTNNSNKLKKMNEITLINEKHATQDMKKLITSLCFKSSLEQQLFDTEKSNKKIKI